MTSFLLGLIKLTSIDHARLQLILVFFKKDWSSLESACSGFDFSSELIEFFRLNSALFIENLSVFAHEVKPLVNIDSLVISVI